MEFFEAYEAPIRFEQLTTSRVYNNLGTVWFIYVLSCYLLTGIINGINSIMHLFYLKLFFYGLFV